MALAEYHYSSVTCESCGYQFIDRPETLREHETP
jgi:predicted RNA-binding Zn-ribbon protein involved in translation (DUF1610 family)